LELSVFVAVLVAAALHASWNALVKHADDKFLSMSAVVLGHAPFALAAMLITPLPAPESWPYLAGGVALHLGYQFFLLFAYRNGEFTQVYPIARGSAPLIVAFVSTAFLGVVFSTLQTTAIMMIGVGLMSLILVRNADGARNAKAGGLALATGCFIAAYSLVDGLGARQAGTALGFFAWLSLFNTIIFAAIMTACKPGLIRRVAREGRRIAIIGGGASFFAFAIVIWGFTKAPIALVTALRETSIVFALLIGVFFMKERMNLAKIVSIAVTLSGAVLLRLSR